MNSMSWRIDVKTDARLAGEMNMPVAILNMKVENDEEGKKEVLQFEMDKNQVCLLS